MNIAVCLKHVLDPSAVEIDPLTGAIDARRLLYIMNPADESALELALQLQGGAGTVTALTVGPARADATLRDALAAGADHVVRLGSDGGSETTPFSTAALLAAALRAEALPDLILCGSRSADAGSGQVPAMLAEFLGWPVVTDLIRLELRADQAVVQRRLDHGAREVVDVGLPAVFALEPGLVRLRHASLPRLMAAQRAVIPVRHPADFGLRASDLELPGAARLAVTPPRPRPRAVFTPDSARPPHERIAQILSAGVTRRSGQVLEGLPGPMAAAIATFLRERSFVTSVDDAHR